MIGLDGQGRIVLPNRSAADLIGCAPDDLIGRPADRGDPRGRRRCSRSVATAPERPAEAQLELHPARTAPHTPAGARRRRSATAAGHQRLRRDLRRHHRAARGAAPGGLGRGRAAHRARGQEPADPDPAVGRAPRAQIPAADRARTARRSPPVADTIIRQVDNIGRLISEFSAFARMPAPVLRDEIAQPSWCARRCYLQQARLAGDPVRNTTSGARRSAVLRRPKGVAGAHEPVAERGQGGARAQDSGRRRRLGDASRCARRAERCRDRGRGQWAGLSRADRERLIEPYVTTRGKRHGLGPCHREEDHGGTRRHG